MKIPKISSPIIRKIIVIAIVLIFALGAGVFASRTNLTYVRIKYSDGHETTVATTKTTIGEILDDNHIILMDDELVYPSLNSTLDLTKQITIRKATEDQIFAAEEAEDVSKEEILNKYVTITEKIITEQEEIPFETITKDISTEDGDKEDKVLQQGQNGIKEIKYRVKYQNEQEIERNVISEIIIQEPVDKIVQIANKVSSRSSARTVASYNGKSWSYSASDMDLICAITAQEDSSSYTGALAVITTACNRATRNGTDPLTEYKKRGQFCYSIDSYWKRRLNGNYAGYVEQAVIDALNGKRNHNYTSFRASGSGERIGGNVYR